MSTEFWSSLKREAENVGVCFGMSLHDHLLMHLDAHIRANRNDSDVEEENVTEVGTYVTSHFSPLASHLLLLTSDF
jgi:hypothetical protein